MRMIKSITVFVLLQACAITCAEDAVFCCSNKYDKLVNKTCEDGTSINLPCDKNTHFLTMTKIENLTFNLDERHCFRYIGDEQYAISCVEIYEGIDKSYILNSVTSTISAVFIILTIIVYFIVPELLDLQGICIVNAIGGIALNFTLLQVEKFFPWDEKLCYFLAFGIYYTFMYGLFWMNMLALHIWRTTINHHFFDRIKANHWKIIYAVYATGGPLILLIIVINLNFLESFKDSKYHPGIGKTSCWFETTELMLIYFDIPMVIILAINLALFIWTILFLWKFGTPSNTDFSVKKYRLKLCIKLFFVMGLPWVFEFLSVLAEYKKFKSLKYLFVITDVINGLTGVTIFLILVVFRKRVMRGLGEKTICFYKFPATWKRQTDSEIEDGPDEYTLT